MGAGRARCQNSMMNDYERVATVIRYLDRHHTEQPDLTELARGAGLSPFHFHRLFSAWAGVTPKDFLQLSHTRTCENASAQRRERARHRLERGLVRSRTIARPLRLARCRVAG
ncbi:MAG: hypothetical protein DMF17_02405 [Verrucomicrobia bacterium]|nr:MAG: hypothetical protein DMF17_02405 [Verrucomicrobiota bacterium]